MKELSIEERAQRYDEAIKRARALNNGETVDAEVGTTVCEYIFPELKDEEGERIRKKLIDLLYKVYINTSYITCAEHDKMVAWLEKTKQNE